LTGCEFLAHLYFFFFQLISCFQPHATTFSQPFPHVQRLWLFFLTFFFLYFYRNPEVVRYTPHPVQLVFSEKPCIQLLYKILSKSTDGLLLLQIFATGENRYRLVFLITTIISILKNSCQTV